MVLSFRAKLLLLVATATLALVAMVASSAITARRVEGHLEEIRRHYLPKVGLRPQLAAQFERIQRGFQDAVAASDPDKLARTADLKKEFLRQLAGSSEAVDPGIASQLERAVDEFHAKALVVSGRLIAHETGENLVAQMAEMQALRGSAAALLDDATRFDESELTNAFASAAEAQRAGSRVRVGLGLACLLAVFLLSLWISRDVLRGVTDLTAGFRRFGEGDFSARIPVARADELGKVARQANQMAQSLQRLESERSDVDWLKSVQSAMSEQLRGELEPGEVAERAASTLCRFLECPVGALYVADGEGVLRLLGGHALPAVEGLEFRPGEGLVGQAALQGEIRIVSAPAEQLQIRSGVAQGSARALALTPLLHNGAVSGVLELASLQPWPDRSTELLAAVRESIAIALDVARSRAELRALLAKTQRQTREVEAQRRALEEKNTALVDVRQRLEQQAAELTQAGAYKSQFLANMSHELRTPLNAILGFTQLIHDEQAGALTDEQRDFLGNVLISGRHLLRLINDVLDLAKVESGKLDFRPELADLSGMIGEVTAILRTAAAERAVQVEIAVDPAIGQVVLDPARFKQVLYNYLSNALKFTPPDGVVTVRARPEGADFFRLEVQDTGQGIQPEDLSRLFVEFQQLDAGAAKKHAGTGLGLALTKRIVEAQGGSVGVRSTPGAGSVFHAVLPRRAQGEVRTVAAAVLQGADEKAPTILVIEDNPDDQARIVEALGAAGFAVETAATGAQALARLRERAFDALTLDLLLPDMSGVDLLASIRAEEKHAHIPVIVLTVVAERGAVAGFMVSDMLAKPIKAADLIDALRRASIAPAPRGPVLVVDDDAGSLRLMEATLKHCGYQTICSRDGEEALQAAAGTPPSAVVLDLIMPRVDGFEFLARFRKMEGSQRTPVIVWTVKDLSDSDRARLRETADAVVVRGKDGEATALLRELKAFLPRRQVSS